MNAKIRSPKKFKKKLDYIDDNSTPLARAARLRLVRNLANLTRESMTDTSGISIHSIRGWELGRFGGLPLDGAEKVIRRVEREGVACSLEWLVYAVGEPPTVNLNQKVLEPEEQQAERTYSLDDEEHMIVNELVLFRQNFKDTIDFTVDDDGMLPAYHIGDRLAGIKHYKHDIHQLIGHNCIVQTKTGKIYLRHLKRGTADNKFHLICINPHTTTPEPVIYNAELACVAPILRVLRKVSMIRR